MIHIKNNCSANDICLGGPTGTFCGNCGADGKSLFEAVRTNDKTQIANLKRATKAGKIIRLT